jgi:hypothetical protein
MDANKKNQQEDDVLRIFLSHKNKDEPIAQTIKGELESYAGQRLEIFMSEGMPFGENWSEAIHKALLEADWLFLLYTDPSADWDWCLYEAGFFAAKDKRRLVSLYRLGLDPPGPMQRWQSVRATEADWVKLLKELYGDPPRPGVPPINTKVAQNEEKLKTITEKILKVIGPKPIKKWYNNYLVVHLDREQKEEVKRTEEVPHNALILATDDQSLKMFDREEKSQGYWSWGELIRDLKAPDELGWIKNLGVLVRNAIEHKSITPCLPLFDPPAVKNVIYRPVIYRIDRLPDDGVKFKLNFVAIPPEDDPRPLGDLGAISVLMTMTRRFLWGYVFKFQHTIDELRIKKASEDKIKNCLKDFDLVLQSLQAQAQSLGLFDRENILRAFAEKEEKDDINEMFNRWGIIREELTGIMSLETIDTKQIEEVIQILKKLKEMSVDFLVYASNRYHHLLQKMQKEIKADAKP